MIEEGCIHIFVFKDHETQKNSDFTEINFAEHKYMNMNPPPQLSSLLRLVKSAVDTSTPNLTLF